MGEADPGGGDSPLQVLQPVEEAEGEGDPARNLWQRKGNYPKKQHRLMPFASHESRLAFLYECHFISIVSMCSMNP